MIDRTQSESIENKMYFPQPHKIIVSSHGVLFESLEKSDYWTGFRGSFGLFSWRLVHLPETFWGYFYPPDQNDHHPFNLFFDCHRDH